MSPSKKVTFSYTDSKGAAVVLDDNLQTICAQILPLARTSNKSRVEMEKANRSIAEIMVDGRVGYTFTPRAKNPAAVKLHALAAATLLDAEIFPEFTDKGSMILPASEIDWEGRSPECAKAERQIWEAVIDALSLNVNAWMLATGQTFSDYPIVKAVQFHIDRVVKERILASGGTPADYVKLTGKVFEEPGKARTKALADLREANETSNPAGETDVSATEAVTAKQNVDATIKSAHESLQSLKVKGLRGARRLAVHNLLNELNLTLQVLLSETKAVPPADKRRVRAADATS